MKYFELKLNKTTGKLEIISNDNNKPVIENYWSAKYLDGGDRINANIKYYNEVVLEEWESKHQVIQIYNDAETGKFVGYISTSHNLGNEKFWVVAEKGIQVDCVDIKEVPEEMQDFQTITKQYAYFKSPEVNEKEETDILYQASMDEVNWNFMPNDEEFYFVIDKTYNKRVHRCGHIKQHKNNFHCVFVSKEQLLNKKNN